MFQDSPNAQPPALAEDHAHRALDGIEKIRFPANVAKQWAAEAEMQSSAHEVLGLAVEGGQPSIAISELQLPFNSSPPMDRDI